MSPDQIVVAPLVIALSTAIAALLVRKSRRAQQGASLLGAVGYVAAVAMLVRAVGQEGIITYQLSAWQAPYGITIVADALSTFMLAFTAAIALAAVVFSIIYIDQTGQRVSYHPLFHFMLVGITGSFLTGDLFNLFVWFEVMLMSSYVLVVFYGGPEHTRAALQYVVLNLLGSAVMLLAIGGLYATTGTLNMADMAQRLADPGAFGIETAPILGLSALLFSVFALKAGIAPFQFWVPAAYRAAPAPVAAMLAGVVKKVGIYAIVRLYFTIFATATLPTGLTLPGLSGESFLAFYGPILFVMAAASIFLGGIGAISQPDVDGLLAHSSIGQVGFIVLPLAVAATAGNSEIQILGVTAALIYSFNHAFAKGLLFLTGGAIADAAGTDRFSDLGGLWEGTPVLAGAFAVGGLSLIGIPPLSGFFGKLLVFDVGAQVGSELVLGVALMGAILTIAYFTRAWNRGFWGVPGEAVRDARESTSLAVVVVTLAAAVVLLGVGFDPVMNAAREAAMAGLDSDAYIDAVLGGGRS